LSEQDEVVDVTDVDCGAEFFGNEMVEGVQVEVGEELRRLIAEGQSALALEGSKEGVAGEVADGRVGKRTEAGDDACGEVQRGAAFDDAGELVQQDGVIDTGKILADIALEGIWAAAGSFGCLTESGVRAEAGAAGERTGEKRFSKIGSRTRVSAW